MFYLLVHGFPPRPPHVVRGSSEAILTGTTRSALPGYKASTPDDLRAVLGVGASYHQSRAMSPEYLNVIRTSKIAQNIQTSDQSVIIEEVSV